ncbi:insulin gene enhancer protein isl-1 isoform X3 [Clupea harengus]|uniref:Insulin gene enhancer protein ISL-1 n=1 Tax=Clupea harengus TaxID=7950 RepID=A0A6P8FKG0_CLUHA|nr:insulin gene enhancer protein isl-1 isoform X3 [Clupea harengus]
MKGATSAQWPKSKAEHKRKKEREKERQTERDREREGEREREWPINAVTRHRSSNTHPSRGAHHSGKIDSSSDSHPQFRLKHTGTKCFHLDLKVDLTPPYFLDMGDMGDPPKKKRLISLCVGCGNQIHDQYILRVSPDLEWHAACLKCAECNQYLDESCTCFVRDGKTYCKRDYIRLYGIKCAKCNIGFSKNDFVMRARSKVYHIECFRCVACSRQLIPGDEFALREDGLFCRADHDVVERATLGAGDPLSPLHPARPLQMAEPISARQPALRPHVHKQPEKTTRVRTVLNEKQLHTLRTCYNANPRPDALMKEQLVEMTSLSPRVIRVWFQNKRCKDKKRSILMKQLQSQAPNDKSNIQGMTGTPMVATSPERHDGGLQANQVEVQSYQAPWKVLSDFALQSEIDQPAFQQLVNFSEGGPGSNSTGSEVASMSSQLPDTPNSMVASPIEA